MGIYEGITYVYGRKTLRFSKGAVDAVRGFSHPPKDSSPLEWGAKLITLGLQEEDPMRNQMYVSTVLHSRTEDPIPIDPLPRCVPVPG